MSLISKKMSVLSKKYKNLTLSYRGLIENTMTSDKDRFRKTNWCSTSAVAYQIQKNQSIRNYFDFNRPTAIRTFATVSKDESQEFQNLFPDFVREINEFPLLQAEQTKSVSDWLSKALYYNIPKGKKTRGLLTVVAYKELVGESKLTDENIRLAQYLGWCVELFHGFLIIQDDIMDQSETRRGQPCWYKLEDVGDRAALCDSLLIYSTLYYVLKKRFGDKSYYLDLIEFFQEIAFITSIGQTLDWQVSCDANISNYSMEKYKAIVDMKTGYSFYYPFALAMYMAGCKNSEALREAKMILSEIGRFFQIQDDFIDCFGDSSETGKIGTDIQNRKCSWPAVVCLEQCNEAQKKIMLECYGHKDSEKIQRVKELYQELDIPNTYANYEKDSYNLIMTHIQQASYGVPRQTLTKLLNKTYKRKL